MPALSDILVLLDLITAHAPALLICVPLLAVPVIALLPGARLAWLASLAVTGFCLLLAIILLAEVRSVAGGAVISYAMGGWAPDAGIGFRIDALNVMVLLLLTMIGLLVTIFAWPNIRADIPPAKQPMFLAAYLLCFTGLCGVAATGDAFNLFVFLEISSIATYVLVALGAHRDRRALPAAINYLFMGTIGASFYVIGIGFLYAVTGTLNMAEMAERLQDIQGNRAALAGYAFIFVGLGLKAAMFPLHQWLPNAYAYAPGPVAVFLAATATKVALYAFVRFLFMVFNPDFVFDSTVLVWIVTPLALTAIIICSLQAVFQADISRILAYSSVAQVGYMLLGISTGTRAGLDAGLFHLINHAVMKGALFMALAGLVLSCKGSYLRNFTGLGRTAPWTMTAFAIAAASLIGIPMTAGFQSKFALGFALFAHGWWWGAGVVFVSSLLAVIYMGRILEVAFFNPPPPDPHKQRVEAPLLILIPLWVLALANIWIGVQGGFVAGLAGDAAALVFSGVVQ